MSLRSKVLFLFLTLAILPLAVVTAFDYVQSVQTLGALVGSENRSIADVAAREMTQLYAQRGRELDALLRDSAVSQMLRGGPRSRAAASDWSRVAGVMSGWLIAAELSDGRGHVLAAVGDTAAQPLEGCPGESGRVLLVRTSARRQGKPWAVVRALARADAIIPTEALSARVGSGGFTAVVDRRDRRVVYRGRCDVPAPTAAALLASPAEDGASVDFAQSRDVRYRGGERIAAIAPIAGSDWSVVATMVPREFTAPFSRARMLFVLLVLFVAGATSVAFAMLLGRFTRSLRDLTWAAGEVAAGNFMPPLPPPGRDEVGRLSYALGVMAGKVQQMLRQVESTRQLATMGEFAARVSHEIRNPLSSIRLNLQGMEREVRRGRADEALSEPLDLCLREVQRLDRVVRGMLDLAREQPLSRRPCSIHDMLRNAVELLRAQVEAQDVRIETRLTARRDVVLGDEPQLRGVVVNLLLNAADAMPEGGTVRIWTRVETQDGGDVIRIHVADEGPGVPQALREQIFRPFMTTRGNGTGLGLPIARRTAEQHGGMLYLEEWSALQGGAEFVLLLPLRGRLPERPSAPASGLGAGSRPAPESEDDSLVAAPAADRSL